MLLVRSFIISLVFSLGIVTHAFSQDNITITQNFDSVTLNSALLWIHKKHDIQMTYNSKIFKKFIVNDRFNNVPLNNVLESLTKPHGYTFEVINEVYVFYKAETSVENTSSQRIDFEYSSFVVDSETGERLPYAKVIVEEANAIAQTDDNGYFYFYKLPSDTVTLMVSYVGYETKKIKLNPQMVADNEPIRVDKNTKIISQIPIYGYKTPMFVLNPNSDALEIDIKEARILPDLGENDIFRLAQFQSGTNGTSERAGELNIRGGESDETLIVLDGFTIYHTDHFYNIFSAVNSNAIKHMQVYKGFSESKFGGRTSGVVEMTGKEGNSSYKETQVDLNFTSANIFYETPLTGANGTIAVSARRSFTDLINTPLYQSLFNSVYNQSISKNGTDVNVFNSDAPEYRFSDVNIKYTALLNKKDKLNLSFYSSNDKLIFSYENEFPEIQEKNTFNDNSSWGNNGGSIRWSRLWSPRYNTRLSIGLSSYRSNLFAEDERINTFFGETTYSTANKSFQLKDLNTTWNNELFYKKHKLTFGAAFNGMDIESVDIQEGFRTKDSQIGGVGSLYFQDQHNNKNFNFNYGVRVSKFFNSEDMDSTAIYIEPRLSIKYTAREFVSFQASYTRNHQFIRRLSEQNLFQNTPDIWSLSDNSNLPVLRADQYSIGSSISFENIELKVEAFYKNMKGTIYNLDNNPLYFSSNSDGIQLSQGRKEVRGLEASIFKSKGKHKGWIALTLNKIRNYDHDIIPYEFTADHDQFMELKSGYIYRMKGWSLSGYFVYGSGRPFSPAIGIYNLELVNNTTQDVLAYSNLNAQRLPDYHRLDLSITKHFLLQSSNQAEIGVSVFNVYNRENISDVRYFIVGAETDAREVVDYNVNMLGILPSIKLKYTF